MQLPLRRSQRAKHAQDDQDPILLTPEGKKRLEKQLIELKRSEPGVIKEVSEAREKGDLSENAEYHAARGKLSSIQHRIFSIQDRLKRATLIEKPASDTVQIGSSVTVVTEKGMKTYLIVGPQEANPTQGRISYVSPLGSALLSRAIGDVVSTERDGIRTVYTITNIE